MIDLRDPDDLARVLANAFLLAFGACGVVAGGVCYWAMLGYFG